MRIKAGLWSNLGAGFGDASHYIFAFCADVPPMPPVQQQENKGYILPPQHNRALLGLMFLHTHTHTQTKAGRAVRFT